MGCSYSYSYWNVHVGTSGDDNITALSGNNIVYSGWGDDTITTGDGNDYIFSGSGDDVISSGGGRDVIYSGRGNDIVDAGAGNDFVWAGSGNDMVLGGAGNDILLGGRGADSLSGGDGCDYLIGGCGNDVIEGNAGNDYLNGGSGHDKLIGGDGCDFLVGGRGNDILVGGAGVDVMYGGSGCDNFVACDIEGSVNYMVGGWGYDTASYGGDQSDYSISYVGYHCWYGWVRKVTHNETGATDYLYSIEKIKFNQDVDSLKEGFTNNEPEDTITADDDALETDEQTTVTGNVLANDTSDLGQTLEVVAFGGGAAGDTIDVVSADGRTAQVTIDANGDITVVAGNEFDDLRTGQADTVTVSYTVRNEDGLEETATVTITINGVSDIDAAADTLETDEQTTVTGNVLANDTGGEGLAVTAFEGAAAGSTVDVTSAGGRTAQVTIDANGDITVVAGDSFDDLAEGATDTVTVSYSITDGSGEVTSSTVTITVNGVADILAVNDTISLDENTSATINALDNDIPGVNGTIEIVSVEGSPVNGNGLGDAVIVTTDGGRSMLVNLDQDGTSFVLAGADFDELSVGDTDTASISYTVEDEDGNQSTASINVTINGVNDAISAIGNSEDEPLNGDQGTIISGQAGFSDLDANDTITFTLIDGPDFGNVTFNADGTFEYTSLSNFNGDDEFTFEVSDGLTTDTGTFNIEVNDLDNGPVLDAANSDTDVTVSELATSDDIVATGSINYTDADDNDFANDTSPDDSSNDEIHTIEFEATGITFNGGELDEDLQEELEEVTGDLLNFNNVDQVSNTIDWDFTIENDLVADFIEAGDTLTFTYEVTITDEDDLSTTFDLFVNIDGI